MEIVPEDFTNTNNQFEGVTFVVLNGTLTINAPYVPPVDPPVPPRTPYAHLTVVKTVTSTPEDEGGYKEGEVVRYSITVTNDGQGDAGNVVVRDVLTDDTWNVTLLAPGASRTFTATYTVTEEDAENGSVRNVATATSNNDDPDRQNTDGVAVVQTLEEIEPDNPPLGPGGAWALVNLIAAVITTITSLIMFIKAFGKKKDDEDDYEDEEDENNKTRAKADEHDDEDDEEDVTTYKRHRLAKILGLIPAIAAIVTFIFTEDMTQKMVLIDKWTLLMVVYLIADLLLAFFAKTKKEEPDDDDDDEDDQDVKAKARA